MSGPAVGPIERGNVRDIVRIARESVRHRAPSRRADHKRPDAAVVAWAVAAFQHRAPVVRLSFRAVGPGWGR